jgi:hypothetical protein
VLGFLETARLRFLRLGDLVGDRPRLLSVFSGEGDLGRLAEILGILSWDTLVVQHVGFVLEELGLPSCLPQLTC